MINLYERYPALRACETEIEEAVRLLCACYENGGKLLLCGNGGSCSDGEHIVGELMKGFLLPRTPGRELEEKLAASGAPDAAYIAGCLQGALPAISLSGQSALLSAFANDVAADMVYAQQVYGYGKPGDVFLGISTSGNARNVVLAAETAKAVGLKTVAMTGGAESRLSAVCDVCIQAPARETYQVQEFHLPIYHYLCAKTEARFFEV